MKVIVITRFKDKYSKKFHNVNDKLTVKKNRYDEIKNFVKIIEEETTVQSIKHHQKNKVNLS